MFQLVFVHDFEKSGTVRGLFCSSTRACPVPQKPLPTADAFRCSATKHDIRPLDESSGGEGSSGGRRAAGWKQPRGKYLRGAGIQDWPCCTQHSQSCPPVPRKSYAVTLSPVWSCCSSRATPTALLSFRQTLPKRSSTSI